MSRNLTEYAICQLEVFHYKPGYLLVLDKEEELFSEEYLNGFDKDDAELFMDKVARPEVAPGEITEYPEDAEYFKVKQDLWTVKYICAVGYSNDPGWGNIIDYEVRELGAADVLFDSNAVDIFEDAKALVKPQYNPLLEMAMLPTTWRYVGGYDYEGEWDFSLDYLGILDVSRLREITNRQPELKENGVSLS
jgi:hypothetical protein